MKIKPVYWELLLNVKECYKTIDVFTEVLFIQHNFEVKKIAVASVPKDYLIAIHFDSLSTEMNTFYHIEYSENCTKKLKKIIALYLGYIIINKNLEFPFICVHIAQSIDGKIATVTGKSKWIGNSENLIHAHRIRALIDAVLVGGSTYRNDKPLLNVRLVKGNNPIKIIIANSELNLEHLEDSPTFLCSKNALVYKNLPSQTEIIHLENNTDTISINELLKTLKRKGVHSILVEGGSYTIRNFINNNKVSRYEFHIAPILFGSGKNGVDLDEIQELNQAIELKNPEYYKMGNAIMVVSNN